MKRRVLAATIISSLVAAGLVVPAFGAPEASARVTPVANVRSFGDFTGFTPALADRRLAAMVGKPSVGARDYQFTPAEARRPSAAASTSFVVRAKPVAAIVPEAAPGVSVKVAPIAYNLGVSVGWKKFGVTSEATRAEPVIGTRSTFDLASTTAATRPSLAVRPIAEQPVGAVPPGEERARPIFDSTNAFRLTRNVDLTAGTRAKTENFRLDRSGEARRDSQAVYVGTALRF